MLELWKPYLKLVDKNNPAIFTEFEEKFSEEVTKRGVIFRISDEHPFVIFFNEKDNCYYYLKARSKFDSNNKIRDRVKNVEVEVLAAVKGLFECSSYVDCSQIFKCDKDLLESLIDINDPIHINTTNIDQVDKENILDMIKNNILEIPPNLSIIEVKLDQDNKTYAKSLYLSQQKLQKVDDFCNANGISLPMEDIKKLRSLVSLKDSDYERVRNRYQNGINFCLLFLNKYFPNKIKDFKNIQKLETKKGGQKMLEFWKPLLVKKNNNGSVIFNVFGDEYTRRPYRPFIIFFNEKDNCYYYLRARSEIQYHKDLDKNTNQVINIPHKVKPNKYEILIEATDPVDKANGEEYLFKKNSLVDCSQIFKCDKDLLESLIDIDDMYKNTDKLHPAIIGDFKLNIYNSIMEIPPYLSIIEVKLDQDNKTYAESLYLSQDLFDDEIKKINYQDDLPNFNFFNSIKNSNNPYHQDRYQNGIDFCLLFLNEYFPNKIKEFKNIQGLGPKKGEQKC